MDQDNSQLSSSQHEQIHPLKEITYGAISGMVGKLVEFPFDTIKVRLQSSSSDKHVSTLKMIKQTYQNEGIFNGFYKGLKAPLVGACLENAILFSSYNTASTIFVNILNDKQDGKVVYNNDTVPFWTKLVSGGFAGFMASFVLTPVELIKCQLQVSNLTNSKVEHSYASIIKTTLRKDGVIGLWKGLNSTILREVIGTAIWFGTYEYINEYFKTKKFKSSILGNEDIQLLISGAMAGVTFNFSMFPVDTIKSNIQTNDLLNHGLTHNGFWNTARGIISKPGGIINLYNGLGITMIRCIPANALIFYTYEFLKQNF